MSDFSLYQPRVMADPVSIGMPDVPAPYNVPDPDESPVELAEALDAVIDAASTALDEGNVDQASSLLDAAEVTSDALLELLGGSDADDPLGA